MEKGKYKYIIALMLLVLALNTRTISAQMLEPVKWSYKLTKINDSYAELRFIANIDNGWHLYSQVLPDDGPLPTEFIFNNNEGFKLVDKVKEPAGLNEYDAMFNMQVKYFVNEAVFVQKIHLTSDKSLAITGTVSYQACDDQRCVSGESNFKFTIKGKTSDEGLAASKGTDSKGADSKYINGTESKGTGINGNGSSATESNKTESNETDSKEITPWDEQPGPGASITAVTDKEVITDNALPVEEKKFSLWIFFWLAFVGGLIAIVTPCVFPMIPMTVSYFMKSGKKGKIQASIYGISIIVIYTFFGTLVAVLFGAEFSNWLSTHWIPNILFFIIFVVFAASFFGYFELTMPGWLINKSVSAEEKGGTLGTLFMALTLVLVSFSCTGPIVGSILVESVGGMVLKPVIGMLGFSLAFAIPFTLFALFPSWLNKLPKSGGWLNTVKVVLGFIELAFALKFLNVPDQTYHWGILDREVYLVIWIVLFAMLGFYLLGKIKFPHDSEYPVVKSFPRLLMIVGTFSFVLYLVPGLWGAPLKGISGWLPPAESQDFDITAIVRDNSAQPTSITSGDIIKSKYSNTKLKLPHGLKGYFDYDEALEASRLTNKPILIDFTGHGCTNCREMENRVWSDAAVLKRLREDFIIAALYVDDKVIPLPEDEWYTDKSGNQVKLLGKKNAQLQIEKFGTNSQPFYVIIDGNGNQLVTPQAYDLDIETYIKFLDQGIKRFQAL